MPKTSDPILPVSITLSDLSSLFEKNNILLEERMRVVLKEEIQLALKDYVTKKDLEKYATKQDLQEAVDAILSGMEEMFKEYPKKNEVVLRKDLKKLASL